MLIFKPVCKTIGSIDFPLIEFKQLLQIFDLCFQFLNIGFVFVYHLHQVILPKLYQFFLILFFFL